jgi:hypothetical protein
VTQADVSILAQRFVSVWGNRIGVNHQGEGMVCRTLRMALLVGAVTAAVVSPARASFRRAPCCNDPCGAPCAPAAPAPAAAPAFRTVTVVECVPETYTVKRTAHKWECRTEQYQACKTECVAETRERVCNVVKRVPVVKTECRKVCKTVNVCEERTVMKTCYKTVQETCMKRELVRLGHWECRETCGSGCGLFGGHGNHHGGCCNDPCADSCAPTRTHRVWVHCPEYCERPVTVCKKVCVQVPTVCKVNVCRQVWETVNVQVCHYECVTEQRTEKYTVMVPHQVTYTATRTVRVCVPYEETVTCCRMVRREKCIQVPCAPACPTTSCCDPCCGRGRLFGGWFGGHHGGGCGDSCCH